MANANFDGELFLEDSLPIDLTKFKNLDDEAADSFRLLEPDGAVGDNIVFDRAIFRYKDPTSPPHTKKECAKWFKPFVGAKICVGWTIRYRWHYRIGYIRVVTIGESDAKSMLEECLAVSSVAAIIAGVASGGPAAIAAAELTLKACLAAKLGEKLLSLSIEIAGHRGDWE